VLALAVGTAVSLTAVGAAGDSTRDKRVVGHMPPLPEERLAEPIEFKCGFVVHEWRGSPRGEREVAHVEELCALALERLDPYLARHGLRRQHDRDFTYDVAFLPDSREYRALNDINFRFYYRRTTYVITGYTSFTNHFLYMTGDQNDLEFDVTLLHEQFHAMSDFYGIWTSLDGDQDERVAADEQLAVGFTRYLGYGE